MRRIFLVATALCLPGMALAQQPSVVPDDNNSGVPESKIYNICHGYPTEMQGIIGFDDPYEIKGKCFLLRIATRFGTKQWLNKNSVLIVDVIPGSVQPYSTIINDPNGHVKYGRIAAVIGNDPIQYTAASGQMVLAPSLSVLKYFDAYPHYQGSGELGEPTKGIQAAIVYPQKAIENKWEGKVTMSCSMKKKDTGLWVPHICKLIGYDGPDDAENLFVDSVLDYYRHSTWSYEQLSGKMDSKYTMVSSYPFKLPKSDSDSQSVDGQHSENGWFH